MKFEESNGPVGVEDPSKAKTKIRRQEKEAPMEASFRKATMPRDKVLVAKIKKSETGYSVTTKGSKERLCESNEGKEKKALQDLVQSLERMLIKQIECVTMLKKEHNCQTLKRRRTLGSDDA